MTALRDRLAARCLDVWMGYPEGGGLWMLDALAHPVPLVRFGTGSPFQHAVYLAVVQEERSLWACPWEGLEVKGSLARYDHYREVRPREYEAAAAIARRNEAVIRSERYGWAEVVASARPLLAKKAAARKRRAA